MLQDTVENVSVTMAGLFNIFSRTCLVKVNKMSKRCTTIFYSFLIMAPLKNRRKKTQINKIVPKQRDVLELPVGSLVWGKIARSPWWPGVYKCVCVNFYAVCIMRFLTLHILINKMHKLKIQ